MLVLFTMFAAVVALLLLVLENFSAGITLLVALILSVLFLKFVATPFDCNDISLRELCVLTAVLLLSAMFRLDVSNYALGGQDQGLYVLIASHISEEQTWIYEDRLRESMPESMLEYYDEQNQRVLGSANSSFYKEGEYEGLHHLGVYVTDLSESKYTFQFYPLNSVWISIFSAGFGKDNGVFAVAFFGWMVVLLSFFLVREASGSTNAGLVAASLFALNPLLVFFSKFPVAEMLSLYYLMGAGYFLLRFKNSGKLIYSCLAVLMLGAMFFTRLSGFMLLPVMFLLTFVGIAYRGTETSAGFIIFGVGSTLLFAAASWFGYEFSYPYVRDIFVNLVSNALGTQTRLVLLAAAVLVVTGYVFALITPSLAIRFIDRVRQATPVLASVSLIVIFGISFFYIYQISYTNAYLDTPMHARWGNAGAGFSSVKFSTLYVLLLFLTPTALLLAIVGLSKASCTGFGQCLILMLVIYLTYAGILTKVTPYLYYYSRYLVSELLPIILILVSLAFAPALKAVSEND